MWDVHGVFYHCPPPPHEFSWLSFEPKASCILVWHSSLCHIGCTFLQGMFIASSPHSLKSGNLKTRPKNTAEIFWYGHSLCDEMQRKNGVNLEIVEFYFRRNPFWVSSNMERAAEQCKLPPPPKKKVGEASTTQVRETKLSLSFQSCFMCSLMLLILHPPTQWTFSQIRASIQFPVFWSRL